MSNPPRALRVCLITTYDLSRDGGVNRQVLGLAHALRAAGDIATVLGPASGAVPDGCVGLPGVVGVPGNGSMAHIGLRVRQRTTLAFLNRHRFDVLHLHAPLIPGPARHAAAAAQQPMVGTFHASCEHETGLSRLVRRVACGPLRRLGAGIAVSRVAEAFSRLIYRGPMHVIPCGIGEGDFAPTAALRPAPRRPLRILFVGRFCEPRKGLGDLLRAVRCLTRAGHAVALTVAGSGRRERFSGLADIARVHFAGRVDDAALARLYGEADVFCAPSVGSESFGLVLIEAMAAGCPVVATRIPGYAEAAAGCALLVPPNAPDALARALWQVGQDAALRARLREAGLARAAALRWGDVMPRVRHVYRQVLGGA